MLVSIIVNNYNYDRFLSRAIESALYQSYPNVEIIVVDDGSTDRSVDIIKTYSKFKNFYAIFKKNGGQASALNEGFLKCRGDVVIFLDSDDVLEEYIVEQVVSAYGFDVSKVQFCLEYVDANENPLCEYVPRLNISEFDAKQLMINYGTYPSPPTSGNAWSRVFLNKVMPLNEDDWRISADSYLIAMAPFYGRVVNILKVGGKYRIHSDNQFYNDNFVSKDWLLRSISVDTKKCQILIDDGVLSKDVLCNNLSHLKCVVALKKLYPDSCPYNYSAFELVMRSLVVVFKVPWISFRSRCIHFLYFLLIFVLPAKVASIMIFYSIFPTKRFNILKRLI